MEDTSMNSVEIESNSPQTFLGVEMSPELFAKIVEQVNACKDHYKMSEGKGILYANEVAKFIVRSNLTLHYATLYDGCKCNPLSMIGKIADILSNPKFQTEQNILLFMVLLQSSCKGSENWENITDEWQSKLDSDSAKAKGNMTFIQHDIVKQWTKFTPFKKAFIEAKISRWNYTLEAALQSYIIKNFADRSDVQKAAALFRHTLPLIKENVALKSSIQIEKDLAIIEGYNQSGDGMIMLGKNFKFLLEVDKANKNAPDSSPALRVIRSTQKFHLRMEDAVNGQDEDEKLQAEKYFQSIKRNGKIDMDYDRK